MPDHSNGKKSRYAEKIREHCAAAGRPELAEPLIRLGYGEQMIAGLIRSGEADRLVQQSGAAPSDAPEPSSKAAEQTDHGWSQIIARVNAELGL